MKKLYNVLEIGGYSDFSCIGPDCEDDCCKGWGITVDKKIYIKYAQIKEDSVKNTIIKNIDTKFNSKNSNTAGIFRLGKGQVCNLQDEDKLCYIHRNLGEEYLCKTCREYPKDIKEVDGTLELSYLLSCPEAVRKILMVDKPIEFNFNEKEIDSDFVSTSIVSNNSYNLRKQLFWDVRSAMIEIFQCRKYKLWKRIVISGLMFEGLDKAINLNEKDSALKVIEKYKRIIESNETLDINIPGNSEKSIGLIIEMYRFIVECMKMSGINIDRLNIEMVDVNKASIDKLSVVIEKYEYVFENYLVNYIFQKLIPLDGDSLTEQYYRMIFNYGFIIALLYGKTSIEEINEKSIVNVIYMLTRTIMHNPERIKEIEKEFKRNNVYSLAYITLAVKF